MPFSAIVVANDIYSFCKQNKCDENLTPMKLQKLLYFIYGIYYAMKNKPLFSEQFEKWKHGPVVPCVYYKFKCFGSNMITLPALDAFGIAGFTKKTQDTEDYFEIIKMVVNTFKDLSGESLTNITQIEGAPWATTEEDDGIIDSRKIKDYFQNN